MARWVIAVALVGLLMPALGWCQSEEVPPDPEHVMQMQRMELEMEQQRSEAQFEREMQQLELEARRLELDQARGQDGGGAAVLLVLCGIIHILVAVWIYQDLRQRDAGSGLWIVLGLLGGLLATLVYAVVRLGDTNESKKKPASR
jgi:Flp pilus assembly protein TadB